MPAPPRQKHDVPIAAIAFVAEQVDVPIDLYPAYDWFGRTIKQHRADIRAFLGIRESTVRDANALVAWLVEHALPHDHQIEHLKITAYTRFRELQLEPPTPDRVERLVRSALRTYEQQFCAAIHAKLTPETWLQIDALLRTTTQVDQESDRDADDAFVRSAFHELKRDPGPLSLESVLTEMSKLTRIRRSACQRRCLRMSHPRCSSTTGNAPPPNRRASCVATPMRSARPSSRPTVTCADKTSPTTWWNC